jgi:hypothetical protein
MNTPFNVNGQPFYILGGQVHNSSGYSSDLLNPAWNALKALRANTAEVPVYWEQVEPREGEFGFDNLDGILLGARERGLHLILLWFATWKNGSMQYAPEWVKNDPDRFPRVKTPGGTETWVLSSHFPETLAADRKAFCHLLQHLKEFDASNSTVIGIQIENEPGILGSVRDYSDTADVEFNKNIPVELGEASSKLNQGPLKISWEKSGCRKSGTWAQVYGEMAAEAFTTWSIARYIDQLAEAGKEIYPLPMSVNAWLKENHWQLPGVNYPSGGPVSVMLDIWKIAAPHIDVIAPDIYLEPQADYDHICQSYHRDDNPLFVPESGGSVSNALNIFNAICQYEAIGYAVFGVESLLAPDGSVRPENCMLVESFQIVRNMLPLITRYHGSGKMQAVIQREFMHGQLLDLGNYLGMAIFNKQEGREFTDFRFHGAGDPGRGRGIVMMINQQEIFLAGTGFRVLLKEKMADERLLFTQATDQFDGPLTHYLRVEEGHFTDSGEWVVDRVRNGDEITNGLWVTTEVGVVHAILAG